MSRVLNLWSGMTGTILDFAGSTAPSGWAMCYGQAVSRTTYPELYAVLCPVIGAFTVTIASPGVFTKTAHGMSNGLRVRLFTTGALPRPACRRTPTTTWSTLRLTHGSCRPPLVAQPSTRPAHNLARIPFRRSRMVLAMARRRSTCQIAAAECMPARTTWAALQRAA